MTDARDFTAQLKVRAKQDGVPIIRDEALSILLRLLTAFAPRRILEIGTGTGYSGCSMLLSQKDAHLCTVELDETRLKKARQNFAAANAADRVTVVPGDVREVVPLMTGGYDFIFLDGPKGQYLALYPFLKELLVEGGCLFCDNVLYGGLVDGRQRLKKNRLTIVDNLRSFIDTIFADGDMRSFLSFAGDGVLFSIKSNSID